MAGYQELMSTVRSSDPGLWDGLMQPNQNRQMIAQQAQPSLPVAGGVYTITNGPEYDRWNEALIQKGRIRIPKELDGPQEWLNMPHIQKYIEHNGIGREDLPDGSVILSLSSPTS